MQSQYDSPEGSLQGGQLSSRPADAGARLAGGGWWASRADHSRHLAVAADAELRRRHPDQPIERLRSAEPAAVSDTDRAELPLAPGEKIAEMAAWVRELATNLQPFPGKLEELQGLRVPSEDPDCDPPAAQADSAAVVTAKASR